MKASADFPKIIIDQSAETIEELIKQTPHGRSWVERFAQNMVRQGKWEVVKKKKGIRLVPAYRRVKK